ncbi:MAG: LytTR family DNA-binding domain-containing protein [Alistipes sp.]|nr:LytTR family DNA-binding domain-containing protein [Alistipes sp.]
MRIAICDQEKGVRNEIESHILTMYPNVTVCQLTDGDGLLLGRNEYDIIYLDRQVFEADRNETEKALREKQPQAILIFTDMTKEKEQEEADDKVRYLAKPFDKVDFFQTLRIAVEAVRAGDIDPEKEEKTIVIKEGSQSRNISISQIIYLQVANRKITLHLRDETVEVYGKLGDYENILGEDFYRPHRTYLVHFKYVKEFNNLSVIMENGEEIPMVRQKYGDFARRYAQYMENIR